jgi:hypothetical protein
MIEVCKATPEMFGAIHPLLEYFSRGNPRLTRAHWQSIFDYTWPAPAGDDTRGFVLMDQGKVVGFEGTIFSQRKIGGQLERFCNITSWIVQPEYRRHALLLTQPILALPDTTLTTLTPSAAHLSLNKAYGFKTLETHQVVLFPLSSLKALWKRDRFFATHDPATIKSRLNPSDLQIFEAHQTHRCQHLLISQGERYTYFIATKSKGRRLWHSFVQYISDYELFLAAIDRVRLELFLANGTLLTIIDERFLHGHQPPGSKRIALPTPRLYISPRLRPEQIDHLYTELILLEI